MYFQQIQTPGLGCYSYLIGCPAAGAMAVVDPKRDIADYLRISREEGMRITHIFETHVHADHVSGNMELAHATGAPIYIHENAGVAYPHTPLQSGDVFTVGAARLEVIFSPGHTPNSISLLVSDLVRDPEPWMLLTGDALFVGDVGRPDLPGAQILGEQVENLYHTLYKVFGKLPDGLEIYPAHGQGSLCGKGMSAKGVSTLGYERRANPMLRFSSYEDFRKTILAEFPVRPQSFDHIIKTNLTGAPLLERRASEKTLTPDQFETLMNSGAVVIDTRDAAAFGGAHIPGSLNIGFESQLANWVGMSVAPKSEILIVAANRERFEAMRVELHRIGYDSILGFLDGGMAAWTLSGRPIESLAQISVHELRDGMKNGRYGTLLDVRTPAEWKTGHIDEAQHMPFVQVLEQSKEICVAEPVAVICGSGYRSNIAGSVLKSKGCGLVASVAGGMLAWRRAGFDVE
jgi:glyoxylase-like metal-dependent hydrolase (beta-lactamase superfamily II)/rhodanese-related sulfurtransferase